MEALDKAKEIINISKHVDGLVVVEFANSFNNDYELGKCIREYVNYCKSQSNMANESQNNINDNKSISQNNSNKFNQYQNY